MDFLPENPVLQFLDNTLEDLRRKYDLDLERTKEAVDILEDWVQKQNHFVKKDFSRRYLESTLLTCKGSIERAKVRLDKMCTFRTLLPQFFGDFDVRHDFKDLFGTTCIGILPKMLPDHKRVIMLNVSGDRFFNTIALQTFQISIMFGEYLKAYEYSDGFIIIVDLRKTNILECVKNINPIDLRNGFSILIEGIGCRMKGIHLVTTSKYVELIITLLKQAISAKLRERLHVHKNEESLHDVVPKEVLPKEYGGQEKSLEEVQETWINELGSKEYREYQNMINEACTDEKFRQADVFNDQYMGTPGSFRSLRVD